MILHTQPCTWLAFAGALVDVSAFEEDVVEATVDALATYFIDITVDLGRDECKVETCTGASTAINGADLDDNSAVCCIDFHTIVDTYANDAVAVAGAPRCQLF